MINLKQQQPEKRWDWSVRLVNLMVFQLVFNKKRMKKGKLRLNVHRKKDSNLTGKRQKDEVFNKPFYNPLIINTRNALGTTIRHKAVLS